MGIQYFAVVLVITVDGENVRRGAYEDRSPSHGGEAIYSTSQENERW
jgi:hypothetical protein